MRNFLQKCRFYCTITNFKTDLWADIWTYRRDCKCGIQKTDSRCDGRHWHFAEAMRFIWYQELSGRYMGVVLKALSGIREGLDRKKTEKGRIKKEWKI